MPVGWQTRRCDMRTRHINIYVLLSLALTAAVFAGCNGSSTATPSGVMNLDRKSVV